MVLTGLSGLFPWDDVLKELLPGRLVMLAGCEAVSPLAGHRGGEDSVVVVCVRIDLLLNLSLLRSIEKIS
jgi:hypothetical protein